MYATKNSSRSAGGLHGPAMTLTGWPVATWVMGRQVYREGRVLTGERGHEIQFDHGRGGYWGTASDFAS